MKKRILVYGVIFTSLMYSCKKENLPEKSEEVQMSYASDLRMIPNPHPIDTAVICLKSSGNANDMNDQLLEVGVIARNLLKNGDYNEYLIQKAIDRQSNSVSLLEFIEDKKSTASNNHKGVFNNLEKTCHRQDLFHLSENPANLGEREDYIHVFHIPNVETADPTKYPIICPGREVNTNIPGNEQYEDFIVGWIRSENGGVNEIILNEEMAMNTTHPVIVIDNGQVFMSNTKKKKDGGGGTNPVTPPNEDQPEIHVYEQQINYRFDESNHSELAISAFGIDVGTGTVYPSPLNTSGNYAANYMEINEIHKDNIGQMQYKWVRLFTSTNSYNLKTQPNLRIYWNTYERDWWCSPKRLGDITFNGSTYYLEGQMMFESEWYAYDPNQPLPSLDVPTILNNWAKWYTNSKTSVRFWKVI